MDKARSRIRIRIVYLAGYLLFAAVALRAIRDYYESPLLWKIVILLTAFLLLFVTNPIIGRQSKVYSYPYLVMQAGVIVLLSVQRPHVEYFAVLFVLLIVDTTQRFGLRTSVFWFDFYVVCMAGTLIYTLEMLDSLQYIALFLAVFIFFASYVIALKRADESDKESRALGEELRITHKKLQKYAVQARELVAIEERDYQARELHDSVTQTLFGIKTTAESADILVEKYPARVPFHLERIERLAEFGLKEMFSLVSRLRPRTVVEGGLIPALRHHLDERRDRNGLTVNYKIDADIEEELSEETSESLFRIVQEALNNVVKHAQTDQADIVLYIEDDSISLLIEDNGIGFDPETANSHESHLGLIGIRDRAEKMDATLSIESKLGEGTRIRVEKKGTRASLSTISNR
ncbi:MAG: sensor histidine kinase [Proteobacteria bacterium]|nr:sensor histidine kinase [Pseudomonadota bacterium]